MESMCVNGAFVSDLSVCVHVNGRNECVYNGCVCVHVLMG